MHGGYEWYWTMDGRQLPQLAMTISRDTCFFALQCTTLGQNTPSAPGTSASCLSIFFPGMGNLPIYLLSSFYMSRMRPGILMLCTNRIADPLFALTMGVSAALTRIRRDQREKYPRKHQKSATEPSCRRADSGYDGGGTENSRMCNRDLQ